MAFFLGHYVGMTEGSVVEKTIAVAEAKVHMNFGRAFVSAVACNWMVCMDTWLHFAAKNTTGQMLAIWFPVMIFVLNGFQHLVANMFVIPAGILAGANITWGQFFFNIDSRLPGQMSSVAHPLSARLIFILIKTR